MTSRTEEFAAGTGEPEEHKTTLHWRHYGPRINCSCGLTASGSNNAFAAKNLAEKHEDART